MMTALIKSIPDWVVNLTILIYCFNFIVINIIRLCSYYYYGENLKYFIDILIPFRRIILDSVKETKKTNNIK